MASSSWGKRKSEPSAQPSKGPMFVGHTGASTEFLVETEILLRLPVPSPGRWQMRFLKRPPAALPPQPI